MNYYSLIYSKYGRLLLNNAHHHVLYPPLIDIKFIQNHEK